MFNVTFRKVGGIRFLSIGRLRFSFCVASVEKAPRKSRRAAMRAAKFASHEMGFARGFAVASRSATVN